MLFEKLNHHVQINAYSRRVELRIDRFTVRMTPDQAHGLARELIALARQLEEVPPAPETIRSAKFLQPDGTEWSDDGGDTRG